MYVSRVICLIEKSLHKKWSFPSGISSEIWPNQQFPADLVTFTEEILNGKLHFFCALNEIQQFICRKGQLLRDCFFWKIDMTGWNCFLTITRRNIILLLLIYTCHFKFKSPVFERLVLILLDNLIAFLGWYSII